METTIERRIEEECVHSSEETANCNFSRLRKFGGSIILWKIIWKAVTTEWRRIRYWKFGNGRWRFDAIWGGGNKRANLVVEFTKRDISKEEASVEEKAAWIFRGSF